MLRLTNDEIFATGMCHYRDHHNVDRPNNARIVVSVGLGEISTQAVIDTGGAFFIVDPELADALPNEFSDDCGNRAVTIRGDRYEGRLARCQITLPAEEGHSHTVEVTAFIPQNDNATWHYPSFLGLSGCLEAFRFAIDPGTNRFYFGPVTPEPY